MTTGKPKRWLDFVNSEVKSAGEDGEEIADHLHTAFNFALKLEKQYLDEVFPKLDEKDRSEKNLPDPSNLALAHNLAQHSSSNPASFLSSYPEWVYIRDNHLSPMLESQVKPLSECETTNEFSQAYNFAMRELFSHLSKSVEFEAEVDLEFTMGELSEAAPSLLDIPSDSIELRVLKVALALVRPAQGIVVSQQAPQKRVGLLQGSNPADEAQVSTELHSIVKKLSSMQ